MPLLFLSLKELALRAVLKEQVSFQDLPPPLRKELDKLSNFPGRYKLIETRSEKFTKTGSAAPTEEEIERFKSHSLYWVLPPPPPTLSISKASTKTHLWFTSLDFVQLRKRNKTNTVAGGYYWVEEGTEIKGGDVSFKEIHYKRSTSTSGGDIPSFICELETLFEMENDKKMKMTHKSIFHGVDIERSQCFVFQRN